MTGGFCRGDIVTGGFCRGDFVTGGFCRGDFCPGGFFPGGFLWLDFFRGDFVGEILSGYHILHSTIFEHMNTIPIAQQSLRIIMI